MTSENFSKAAGIGGTIVSGVSAVFCAAAGSYVLAAVVGAAAIIGAGTALKDLETFGFDRA